MTEVPDLTLEEFCEKHNACDEGRKWAFENCKTMVECWEKLSPDYLVWTATRPGVLPEKELRLFSVFCCRSIWYLLTDERSRKAVEVAENVANGKATFEELEAARAEARAVANAAAKAVYDAATRATAYAARAATYATAVDSYKAAEAADAATYWVVEAAGTIDAAVGATGASSQKQADWLRSNTTPNFKRS